MNITSFTERELEKIGITCRTESIFDLGADQSANENRACPGCGDTDFLEYFTLDRQKRFNCVTYYKAGRDKEKKAEVRFYFSYPNA